MSKEIETKVLDIDSSAIARKMDELGAKKILQTRLTVDWYGPKGLAHNGDDPWYLRLRTSSEGASELAWKSVAKYIGNTRQSEEITFSVSDRVAAGKFFEALNLENYAHQEKDRTSWTYQNWRFDLDQYPGMPAYLEIEGESEPHIAQAIALLNLQNKKSVPEGEAKLIREEYGLDWNDMRY